MYTQTYSCLSMEIILKADNKDIINYINFILCDLTSINQYNLKGQIVIKKDGEYYKGFVENKIVFKASDIYEMALFASSEIINMFVHSSQNTLFLHAGGIEKNGKVTLIAGQSKSGKTSIIISILKKNGYSFISDEIIPISLPKGNIISVKRCLSVRSDMMEKLNLNNSLGNEFKTIDDELVTFIPYKNIISCDETTNDNKIDKIIFPQFSNDFALSECSSKEAFNNLLGCSVNMKNALPQAFDFILKLLSEVKCYSLRFNDLERCVKCITEL